MKTDSPALQLYPKDLLADPNVIAMSLEALGAYTKLLCICWLEVTLPNDEQKLRRLSGATAAQWRRIWPQVRPCFHTDVVDNTVLRQKRLDEEREKQRKRRRDMEKGGKKGAAKRWGGHGQANGHGMGSDGSPSPDSSLRNGWMDGSGGVRGSERR